MRKLKLNNDLSSTDQGLTRRQVKNIRDRLSKQAAYVTNLLEAHLAKKNTCQECQGEYELELSKVDLDIINLIWRKTVPDSKDETLDDIIDGPKTEEELTEELANAVTHQDGIYLSWLIKHDIESAKKARDYLINNIPDNVLEIASNG